LRILQLIQIVGINGETLAEPLVEPVRWPRVNPQVAAAGCEKGGVRIAEAAFRQQNPGF
jgi:hypothetical protein